MKTLRKYGTKFESPTVALMRLLKDAFPEHPWDENEFKKSMDFMKKYSSIQNQREFFDSLAKKIGIKQPSDWYNVSLSQVCLKV